MTATEISTHSSAAGVTRVSPAEALRPRNPAQAPARTEPQGMRPRRITVGRIGLYAFLISAALFFMLPLWIMVVTSLKPMEEIRLGNIVALPATLTFNHIASWSQSVRSSTTC
jgi:hypothetical protein